MNDPITLAATDHEDRHEIPDTQDRHDDSTGPGHPPPAPAVPAEEPHTEPVQTLLETAATCRPVEEVTELVSLLKRTGQQPDVGHAALRAAAVSRPVDEVGRMVALLGEPPHGDVDADVTLRAAAVGRSIEDVALLAGYLDTDRGDRTEAPAGPTHARPPVAQPPADHHPAPHRERPPVTRPEPRPPAPRAGGALRHVLRWPVAAALLLCGVLHLPGDPGALSVLGLGDVPPLAVAFLCLVAGGLLMARDTPAVWRTGAVTALAVVALHVVAGIALVDPLEGSLGGLHAWAGVTTVLCAGAGAVLAGVALMYRPKRVDRV
ncbi:hypothetical protein OG906_05165 [Streptomyces sp. NBC_01426]|uniref:hypothetical protein n=1 Tax=Streptomyces sp. NBC_01426 TaxID=2975866 RepID=UPI002E2FC773|nr:hypothetical protein [Streptomyces sp. NBC_01426]